MKTTCVINIMMYGFRNNTMPPHICQKSGMYQYIYSFGTIVQVYTYVKSLVYTCSPYWYTDMN